METKTEAQTHIRADQFDLLPERRKAVTVSRRCAINQLFHINKPNEKTAY